MPRTPTTSAFPVCLPAGRGATPGRPSPAFLYLFWDVISARLIPFEMPAGRSSAVPAVLLVWPRGLLMEPAPPRPGGGPCSRSSPCRPCRSRALRELTAVLCVLLAPAAVRWPPRVSPRLSLPRLSACPNPAFG